MKRVLIAVPFFYAGLCTLPVQASCSSPHYDESVRVATIHDGDTLRLTDGRKLRLIGINTPELARDQHPAEPYAKQAREYLVHLLAETPLIKLKYGQQRQDHYGRLLAHVFLPDGRNVNELLLRRGLGQTLSIPPNLWANDCYLHAEQTAQQSASGLWQHPRYQPIDANTLNVAQRGFYRVRGTISRVEQSREAYWLKMSTDFTLKIKKTDAIYFQSPTVPQLAGKTVIARGWLYPTRYKNRQELRMRIHHPAALNVVE